MHVEVHIEVCTVRILRHKAVHRGACRGAWSILRHKGTYREVNCGLHIECTKTENKMIKFYFYCVF